ncbi:hypothetical protein TEHAL1_20050 [Tetragenococcus halophilus]|nr:hypothetical protein TEHN0098T_0005 [Tetragenococcus halophilus subsp. halophilus]GFK22090.1 hypothetical protein WJ7_15530 [Tetragenococcus halophilus]GMA09575.1 hypothetical protein GCM10025886_27280 [Tetragenococcus halophilus subsp. flandriensis]GBD79410.1 hypothetical protein TEHD10_0473 [Tetragenococcus halophilus subsp. halophilus]GFK24441.1 hypothetical protein YA163_15040 [Tetragenococcus halophilus]
MFSLNLINIFHEIHSLIRIFSSSYHKKQGDNRLLIAELVTVTRLNYFSISESNFIL